MPQSYFPNVPMPRLPSQSRAAALQNQQAALNIEQGEQRMRLADMAEQRAAEAHRLDVQAAPSIQTQRELSNEKLAQDLLMNFAEQSSVTAYSKLNTTQDGTPEQKKTAQQWVMERADELERLERAAPTFAGVKEKFLNTAQSTDPVQLMKEAAETYRTKRAAKRGGTPTSSEGPRDSKNPETGLWHKESRVTFDPSTQSYKTTYVGQGHAKEEDLYRGEGLKEEAKQAAKTWGGKGGVVETAEASIPELQSARASMEQFQALNEETPTGFGAELGYKATALLNFLAPSRVRDNDAANAAALRTVSMDMLAARFNMAKGAISDMEFSAFANSIPSLMNSERGNDLIIATMRQLNDFSFERAMAIRRINSGPGDSQDKKELLREFDEMQRKAIKAAGKALKKEVEEIKKSQSRAYTIGDLISSIKGEAVTGRPTPPSEYPPEVQEDLLQGF